MRGLAILALTLALAPAAFAGGGSSYTGELPECLDNRGQPLQFNNAQVLEWKKSTPNLWRDRGFIRGTIANVNVVNNTHLHLEVYIGSDGSEPGRDSEIEVIYNQDFGEAPWHPRIGATVIACGDYITSTEAARYPASPDGAILHWVHRSNNSHHPNGFFMIDDQMYGMVDAPGPWEKDE